MKEEKRKKNGIRKMKIKISEIKSSLSEMEQTMTKMGQLHFFSVWEVGLNDNELENRVWHMKAIGIWLT